MSGSSGSSSTTTVDYEYNDRMATIAETNQQYADEMYNMFKYGVPYNPYAESGEKIKTGNKTLNPEWEAWNKDKYETYTDYSDPYFTTDRQRLKKEPPKYIEEEVTKTYGEVYGYDFNNPPVSEMQLMQKQIEAQASLLPAQTELQRQNIGLQSAQIEQQMGLLPLQGEVAQAGLEAKKQAIGQVSNLYSKLYDEAMTGVDVDEKVAQAKSGVMQSFAQNEDITRRNLSRMGIDPSSGAGVNAVVNTGMQRAQALAGAETTARNAAEEENFKRLQTATNIGLGGLA